MVAATGAADFFAALFGEGRGGGRSLGWRMPCGEQLLLATEATMAGTAHRLEVYGDGLLMGERKTDGSSEFSHRLYLEPSELIHLFTAPEDAGPEHANTLTAHDGTLLTFWRTYRTHFGLNLDGPGVISYAQVAGSELALIQTQLGMVPEAPIS
jgi:hypothetical protein